MKGGIDKLGFLNLTRRYEIELFCPYQPQEIHCGEWCPLLGNPNIWVTETSSFRYARGSLFLLTSQTKGDDMLLALDPGYTNTGWVLFEDGEIIDSGCIKTEKTKRKGSLVSHDHAARCSLIAKKLAEIIREHDVQGIVGELPSSGGKSSRAVAGMARAGAIPACVAAIFSIPCEWCTPFELKKHMTGNGNAGKGSIQAEVLKRYPSARNGKGKGDFEHIADAIGAYETLSDGVLVKTFG
jgi:Holliday junction resolvasome RuvABC endonuclease subunit